MPFRHFSLLEQYFFEIDYFIQLLLRQVSSSKRTYPAKDIRDNTFSDIDIKKIIRLMRVNHTGEMCAQGLYRGQAFVANEENTKVHLNRAAKEEYDHLSWCQTRIKELDGRPSVLNPIWYIASFKIGMIVALISDRLSYSFIIETENQVRKHLVKYLDFLPRKDKKSRAILQKMYVDESKHAEEAVMAGGSQLPFWMKALMKAQSKVMTTIAYFI